MNAVDEGTAVKIERDILQHLDAIKRERGLTDDASAG